MLHPWQRLVVVLLVTAMGTAALWLWAEGKQSRRGDTRGAAVLPTPLFDRQLDDMFKQFDAAEQAALASDGRSELLQTPENMSVDAMVGSQDLAFIFPSEAGSACVGSACVGSACAGSACAASGCGASACAGSGCGASACGGSACAGSACGGSLCIGSVCGASACNGSACGGSGCNGSACVGSACQASACVGSACAGSHCVGSACSNGCSQLDQGHRFVGVPGQTPVVAASCPYGNGAFNAEVTVVSFDATYDGRVTRIRWSAMGDAIERYRVWRLQADRVSLVVEQATQAGRLVEVVDTAAAPEARYVVDILDSTGWVTRVSSDGSQERLPVSHSGVPAPPGRLAAAHITAVPSRTN